MEPPEEGDVSRPKTIFDVYSNKMIHNAMVCREHEQSLLNEIKNLELKIDTLNDKFKSLVTSFELTNENTANFIHHLKLSEAKALEYQQDFGNKYSETIAELTVRLNQLSANQSNQADICQQLNLANNAIENYLNNHQGLLDKILEQNMQMGKDLDLLRITKVDNKEFEEMTTQVMARVQKSLIKIQDVDHRLVKTDNYISRYLPFNNFC